MQISLSVQLVSTVRYVVKLTGNRRRKMKLRKLLTVGLLTSTLLSPLTAFAETKTKDITDPNFLEFVEQLCRENPKL